MPYSIGVSKSAKRDLESLEHSIAKALSPAISSLADDPRPDGCRKLHNARSVYRVKAGPGKNFRIVYHVDDRAKVITILEVKDRKDSYRNF